jgi:flagellar motor switch protein FliN/FliY
MTDQLQWLQREWAEKLSAAIESMIGEPVQTEALGSGVKQPDDRTTLYRQPLDAGLGAEIWVQVPKALWAEIGGRVLRSAGLEDSTEQEAHGTFLEVLQQSLSPLAQSIGSRLKREVAFLPGTVEASAGSDLRWGAIGVTLSGEEYPPAALAITDALKKALADASEPAPARGVAPVASPAMPAMNPEQTRSSKTMDLLLEVELPVGVSFGRVQMKLRDAVKLTTGSIVELNRRVTEPVEVIVNNCVIARGEVVVVEGNYGVRIQEIVSREERLRTLF